MKGETMEITVNKFTVLKVEDRGNHGWQIMEGWRNKDGDFKPSWCTRKTGKEQVETVVPMTVRLGNRDKAIEVLTAILAEIRGVEGADGDDAPF
jgi:hypothetical protein